MQVCASCAVGTYKVKWHWIGSGRERARRIGYFEGRRENWLSGWAHDPAASHKAQKVLLLGGNGVRRIITADRHRADVQRAGYGDGYCGFRVEMKPFLEARHVECRWLESNDQLPGSPRHVERPAAPLVRDRGSMWVGLDAPLRGDVRISGFVVDSRQPYRRARLGLFRGSVLLAVQRACLYRGEAASYGGDGFNGFAFFDAPMDHCFTLVDLDRQHPLGRVRR
jgi:hypothetical protein